jgi:CubicO group peptidase (beta-lactamase class C family)
MSDKVMLRSIIIIFSLVTLFFFGEIALTFSEDANAFIIENEEVAFSLKLENQYSDFDATTAIDNSVETFLRQWGIKGASVAISKDEELVYAKGFGYANVDKKEAVKPGHLFRIASVSKLITAAAVMKLFEEGHLDLDEYAFGPAGVLDTSLFRGYKDKRVEEITIRHLLNHTAGWSKQSGDPMFNSLYIARKLKIDPPAKTDHVIEYALSRNLNYDPGTRYSYSNLGYGVLGRIIEVKSGMPYEDYVIMNLLKPSGIHDMHIGRSFAHEKYPNEVTYYNEGKKMMTYAIDGSGQLVPFHYGGNNIELLGAAGGWVASAPELCKLMTVLDGFNKQQDILEKQTLEMMVDPDMAGMGLFGWRGQDHYGTWWRTGYISGSTALLVRQRDGVNWVILMNTSTYRESRIQRYTSSMMFSAVNKVKLWPYLDLFLVDKDYPGPIADIPVSNPLL